MMLLFVIFFAFCLSQTTYAQQQCPMGSKGGANSLRVMTYNIRLNTAADGENQWPKRKSNVFTLIRSRAPDLLAVQEALPLQINDLKAALPNYLYYGVGRTDGKNQGEYSAIFYRGDRLDLLKSGTFWLSPTPNVAGSIGWDAAITRICSWIQVRDKRTQQTFYHFNTHFDHKGVNARLESSRLIVNQIKTIAGSASPVIFTGDLNVVPNSDPYRAITTNTDLKDAKSLSETAHCGPDGTASGFNAANVPSKRIDFIFVNSKFKVVQHGILKDSNNGFYPSDHLPVLVEVAIQNTASG